MRNDNGKDLRNLFEGKEKHRLRLRTLGLPVKYYDLSRFPCNRTIRLRNSTTMAKLLHLVQAYEHMID